MKKKNLVYMTKVCILSALAAVIMLLEFPLPFAPPFYKLDLSEIVILIAGFGLGPLAGVLAELIKILLNLCFNGTDTALVGEFANFCIGVSFVLPAAFIYKKCKKFKGGLHRLGGRELRMDRGAFVGYRRRRRELFYNDSCLRKIYEYAYGGNHRHQR